MKFCSIACRKEEKKQKEPCKGFNVCQNWMLKELLKGWRNNLFFLLWCKTHFEKKAKYLKRTISKLFNFLNLVYTANILPLKCLCTSFLPLGISRLKNTLIYCHADWGAKTSTKQVTVADVLSSKPLWLWLAIYLLWILGHCKDIIKYSYALSLWPRSQDKYKASPCCTCFVVENSMTLTSYILALAP